jgi:hypothetical protein
MTLDTGTVPPITLDLGPTQTIARLAIIIEAPIRTVRHFIKVAALIAAARDVNSRAAMLELADAYGRAATAGQYSELIRTEMLRAELRARRLAEHLS